MSKSIVVALLVALVSPLAAAETAPAIPEAGAAQLTIDAAGSITLGNEAFTAHWRERPGLHFTGLTDRWGATTLPAAEPFVLVFADGRRVAASTLARRGRARRIALPPQPAASRRAERFGGAAVEVRLADPPSGLTATWRAVLRDGSPYLRTELTLASTRHDVALAEVVLVELPQSGWRIAGSVAGSPAVAGSRFLSTEHPMAETVADANGVRSLLRRKLPLRRGTAVTYSAVIGFAPPGQLRRGLLAYVERERAHPYRPFLHYNSWYDIGYFTPYTEDDCLRTIRTWGRELVERRGVPLASFLFDDGWDDTSTVWEFHRGFPRGFAPLREEAARFGAAPGVWLSPWGGYGKPREARLATGKAQGYEVDDQGFALSGPRYFARFRSVVLELLTRYGINQFKLDGTGSPDKSTPGSGFDSDFAAAIALVDELRVAKPDLFVNLTTGTWPSPFWLRTADSIWRGGSDHELAGVGSARQRWITYRDADTYGGVVTKGPLFPLTSLMLHGVIYARHAQGLADDPGDDFRDEVRSYFGSGTQLQELYVSPDRLTPEKWDDLAEAARFARERADLLVDTHWVGGDPAQLEVYGWAAWSARRAVLTLRNPADRPQRFSVEIERLFELPAGAPASYLARRPWREQRDREPIELSAGMPRTLTLAPFEVLTLELEPGARSAAAVAPPQPAPPGPRSADRHRLACLGEALADPGTPDWCERLAMRLGAVAVRSSLRRGATLADLAATPDLASFAPGRVVVLPGLGELGHGEWDDRRDGWSPALRAVLERLRELPGAPELFVLRPDPLLLPAASGARATIEGELAPLAVQAARAAGATVVDLAFLPSENGAPDEVAERVTDSAWLALSDARARKAAWKAKADNEGGDWAAAALAVDGDPATYWMTQHWRGGPRHPHTLEVDLGAEQRIAAVVLLPPQDGTITGRIRQLELFTRRDGSDGDDGRIERTLSEGPDSRGGARAVRIALPATVVARYLKLVAWSEVAGGRGTALAEVDVLLAPPAP